jgi:peptidoglycan/LPS O-acetylase OafA/YrhL
VRISIHRQRPLFSALFLALYFGTGTLIYLVRDRLVINGLIRVPLAALFVLAQGSRFAELSTALLLGYAIVWAASFAFGQLRASCNRIDVSFGVYIYAGPIQQALIEAIPGLHPALISLAAFAFVLPLALLSWLLIEHPAMSFRALLRQKLSFRTPAAPVSVIPH